jgi:hypothetical protein
VETVSHACSFVEVDDKLVRYQRYLFDQFRLLTVPPEHDDQCAARILLNSWLNAKQLFSLHDSQLGCCTVLFFIY